MDILGQIGINETAIVQFLLFTIALTFLVKVVFTPYFHALEQRQQRTKGGEDLAVELHNQAQALNKEYESKVRELNDKIKTEIDSARSVASKTFESSIATSRADAEKYILENRKSLETSIQLAARELEAQTTSVAMAITNKLIK